MLIQPTPGKMVKVDRPYHPFDRPAIDSYGYPAPPPGEYKPPLPTSGHVRGSMFYLYNNKPYLVDNSHFDYGPYLTYSESVVTKLFRRNDPTCLNMSAVIDMTNSDVCNHMMNNVLNETIVNQYEALNGILPIIKSDITFKLYFHIEDMDGIVVHQSSMSVQSSDIKMHFTDIRDRFVFSSKNIFNTSIPAVHYRGMYTIIFDRIEAYMKAINSIEHTDCQSNRYYTFIQDNTKIALQHETIQRENPDEQILLSSTDIGLAFNFQANLSTRLKFSFTAFIPSFIVAPDTFKVWCGLIDPRSALVRDLATKVDQLTTEMETLLEDVDMIKADNSRLADEVAELRAFIENTHGPISVTPTTPGENEDENNEEETPPVSSEEENETENGDNNTDVG